MKKITLVILLSSFAFGFSQKKFEYKTRHFPVRYILKNSKDTLSSRIMNVGAVANNDIYSHNTWVKKLVLVDELGKKKVMKEEDFKYLEITDPEGVVRKFYSSLNFCTKDLGLVEVIFQGKKSTLFDDYNYINIYGNLGSTTYVAEKGKELIYFGLFGFKKKLRERFGKYPDLVERLNNYKNIDEFISILKDYDSK